jgi:hypothetical protein
MHAPRPIKGKPVVQCHVKSTVCGRARDECVAKNGKGSGSFFHGLGSDPMHSQSCAIPPLTITDKTCKVPERIQLVAIGMPGLPMACASLFPKDPAGTIKSRSQFRILTNSDRLDNPGVSRLSISIRGCSIPCFSLFAF